MESNFRSLRNWTLPRFTDVVIYLGFLLLLGVLATATSIWLNGVWDGMEWLSTNTTITTVTPGGPADRAGIAVGDRLIAIEGTPVTSRFPLYDERPGEKVAVTYERNGEIHESVVELWQPPAGYLLLRLTNLAIALLFGIFSVAFSVGERTSRASMSFALVYQLLAILIAAGSVSAMQYGWAVRVYLISLLLLIPAVTFMAANFPVVRREFWVTRLLIGSFMLALLLLVPALLLPLQILIGSQRGYFTVQLSLVLLLGTSVLDLIIIAQSFLRASDAVARAAIRISLIGLLIGILPFFVLYLIPRVILGRTLLSAEVALLFLVFLPLYHGFAITRRRFGPLESLLPTLASSVVCAVLFVTTILLCSWFATVIWPDGGQLAVYAGAAVGAVILAATNIPVVAGTRRLVHHAFYGQAYDYQSVISEMSRDLAQAVGRDELGELIVDTLCRRMNLAGAAVLSMVDKRSTLEADSAAGSLAERDHALTLRVDGVLAQALWKGKSPEKRESLQHNLRDARLSPEERDVLTDERIALWVPIIAKGALRGIVILGNKNKDALFSYDDLDITATLAGLVGVSMENADLYDHLRAEMRKLQEMQEQLVQAEKLSAVGELVSGVAHELNNPLTAVIGYGELLRSDITDPEARKDVDNILRAAERSRRIVRNLLTFARRQKAERSMIDINEVVRQTIEIQDYQLRMDNVVVETHLDPNLPMTAADSSQIQQVLLNIMMNAHQSIRSAKNEGKIIIKTELSSENAIRISISDDGPGVPPDIIGRIFDPFFTTKEVGVGTGLGLSICYGIVTQHGGNIWCESEPGKGATFIVELPMQQIRLQERLEPEQKYEAAEQLRVLVVDDEIAVAAVLSRLLAKKGHYVDTASSAVDGLEKLKDNKYDIVISDVKMPGMGGAGFWDQLKTDFPDVADRVIFVTGDTASPDTSAFLREAGQPVLPKPFGTEDLSQAIAQLQSHLEAMGSGSK